MKLYEVIIRVLAIVILTIVFVMCISHALEPSELCIIDTPKKVTGDSIKSVLFSGTPVCYIWYAGTFEDSREECEKRIRVTIGEYERQIYGGNTK